MSLVLGILIILIFIVIPLFLNIGAALSIILYNTTPKVDAKKRKKLLILSIVLGIIAVLADAFISANLMFVTSTSR